MNIHHIGYLTKNLKAAAEKFIELGFQVERTALFDSYRVLDITFLMNGSYRVELIEPKGVESPLYPLLKKYKNTPYHFCYEVDDLTDAIQLQEERGYRLIQEPREAVCIGNRKVAFLIHADMGIIELLELHGEQS